MEFRDVGGNKLDILDAVHVSWAGLWITIDEHSTLFRDRSEVTRLRDALSRWLETGSVEERTE